MDDSPQKVVWVSHVPRRNGGSINRADQRPLIEIVEERPDFGSGTLAIDAELDYVAAMYSRCSAPSRTVSQTKRPLAFAW